MGRPDLSQHELKLQEKLRQLTLQGELHTDYAWQLTHQLGDVQLKLYSHGTRTINASTSREA